MMSVTRLKYKSSGITLIEFALIVMIASLVYGMVSPAIYHHMDSAKTNLAKEEIKDISGDIDDFIKENGRLPDSLVEVFGEIPLDEWGNPYQYLKHEGAANGKLRKDKNLVPINSDYDLFSMGEDGNSVPPLTAQASKDDIVRANDGKWVGKGEDY